MRPKLRFPLSSSLWPRRGAGTQRDGQASSSQLLLELLQLPGVGEIEDDAAELAPLSAPLLGERGFVELSHRESGT